MICNLNHCGEEAQIEDSANIEQGGGDSLISQFLSTDLISQMIPSTGTCCSSALCLEKAAHGGNGGATKGQYDQ